MHFPEWLYTIDVVFVVLVLLVMLRGARNGLSGELAHAVTLLALLAGFVFYYPQLMQLAAYRWTALPPETLRIAVPAAILLAAAGIFLLSRALFKLLIKKTSGTIGDKLAGGLAGAVRGAAIGLVLLAGLSLIPNEALYSTISEKSDIGAWVCRTLTPWLKPRIETLPVVQPAGGGELPEAGVPVFQEPDWGPLLQTEEY